MLIILSGSCRLRFFEHSLVGCGQRFARSSPKGNPTADDNSGEYYIELLFFTQAPTLKFLGMDLINTLKTNLSVGHNDKSWAYLEFIQPLRSVSGATGPC